MTAIADKIRTLLGLSGTMGLDAMANNLGTAQDEVNSQENLLDQALTAIAGKAAGGSGGNSGAFSASEEFIWTAPSDITKASGEIVIQHSLGVIPDGYHLMALEAEWGTETEHIINNIVFDRSMLYAGYYSLGFAFGIGDVLGHTSTDFFIDAANEMSALNNIIFPATTMETNNKIPKGKQYRVLVYKR
jgi:hypothetical protein